MRFHLVPCIMLSCALSAPLLAQSSVADEVMNAADERDRQARIAITGDLGLPPLPPVTASSPLDSMLYADRFDPRNAGGTQEAGPQDGTLVTQVVPASQTGTGFTEVIVFQLGDSYSDVGTPHPLVVAYHGFGSSAMSVSNQSTIDEECNARGWVYMAPTGLDDQLFGSPVSQKNTAAGIQWMLDNYNVDPDRIYMIGFSMGGGIALNFAARHRDPDGIMIAAVGAVSSGLDWTQTYATNPPDLQDLLENSFNFGGPPSTRAFWYDQASVLHMDTASYPPLPGTLDGTLSMGSNLGPVPTYITYDDQDQISTVPSLNQVLETYLGTLGTTVQTRVQSGTQFPGPPTQPAPHSWYVLDETECFNFLDGKVVDRHPAPFQAIQDVAAPTAWVTTSQARSNEFSFVNGTTDDPLTELTVDNIQNVDELTIDVGAAGVSGIWPVRIAVTNVDVVTCRVRVTGFDQTPSRLHQTIGAALVTLVDSDPDTGSLLFDLPGGTTKAISVIHQPNWDTVLTISPSPVGLSEPVAFHIDGPSTSQTAWLVISDLEFFTPVESLVMTALPLPPAVLIYVGLDVNGDLTLNEVIPNDPILEGIRLPTQVVTVNSGVLESVSNLWGFYID